MNMKSLKTQFIGAIAMVLVAAIAMGSSTYAWFSLNSKVTVTGMNVHTQVSNNLLIEPATMETTDPVEANFKTSMVANISALLQPTSTVDGKAYFYTDKSNVLGTGNHIAPKFYAYNDASGVQAVEYSAAPDNSASTAIDDFRENSGYLKTNTDVWGFVDYVFILKAQNTSSDSAPLQITGLNLVYGNTDGGKTEKAFRVAVLAEKYNGTDFTTAPGALQTILTSNSSTASTQYFTAGSAVDSTTSVASIGAKLAAEAKIADVTANTTEYFKVVVRLWLEGEDATCNNDTYVNFSDKWALDIAIELDPKDGSGDPISGVTQFTATYPSKNTLYTGTNTAGAGVDFDGTTYYPLTGTSLYTLDGTFETTSRVFTIIPNGHPIEVTNQYNILAGADPNP